MEDNQSKTAALTVKISPEFDLVISVEQDAIIKNLFFNGEFAGTSIEYFEEIVSELLPSDP